MTSEVYLKKSPLMILLTNIQSLKMGTLSFLIGNKVLNVRGIIIMKDYKKTIQIHIVPNKKNINAHDKEIYPAVIEKEIDTDSKSLKESYDRNLDSIIKSALQKLKNEKSLRNKTINLCGIKFDTPHIDIGGSGEAIIYKVSKKDITIIDNDIDVFIKNDRVTMIKMDARNMNFDSKSFNTATLFYTLMYVKDNDIKIIMKEIYRILKNNGVLLIWDICINDIKGEYITAPITVVNGKKKWKVTYSADTVSEIRNACYYKKILEETGFNEISIDQTEDAIFIKAVKL